MTNAASRFVADLTWDVVRDRLAEGAPAILPVGAGSKQHGLHLPLAADAIQAEWFAAYAAHMTGGLVWPALTYGHYPAFTAYAGSVSLQRQTFEAVAVDILEALLRQTRTFVVIVDTGISTVDPIEQTVARCSNPARVLHLAVYRGAHFIEARSRYQQQLYGSHADEIETSIMLAIAPDKVAMTRAKASPAITGAPQLGALTPDDAASPNFAPSGSFGDPTLATEEKGSQLVAAILQDIDEACTRARRTATR